MPHTVIYKNELPTHWYFMDKNQIIRKKKNQNVNKENLINAFLYPQLEGNIYAYVIYYKFESDQSKSKQNSEEYIKIKYLTKEDFLDFLNG